VINNNYKVLYDVQRLLDSYAIDTKVQQRYI